MSLKINFKYTKSYACGLLGKSSQPKLQTDFPKIFETLSKDALILEKNFNILNY